MTRGRPLRAKQLGLPLEDCSRRWKTAADVVKIVELVTCMITADLDASVAIDVGE